MYSQGQVTSLSEYLNAAQRNGRTPATTAIAAMPRTSNSNHQIQLDNIKLLQTFANVNAMATMYQDRQTYNLSDPAEAAQFTRDAAQNLNSTMDKKMEKYLRKGFSQEKNISEVVNYQNLHDRFLSHLFGEFDINNEGQRVLDNTLSAIFKKLIDVDVSMNSGVNTVDHMIFTFFFEDSGKIGKLRVFYIRINSETWEKSVGKHGEEKEFGFDVHYSDNQFDMIDEIVQVDRVQIIEGIQKQTEHNFHTLAEMCAPIIVYRN